MKSLLFTLVLSLALCACAPFTAKKYHTAAITPPSLTPIKDGIDRASAASRETSRHIDRVDYKSTRALNFF